MKKIFTILLVLLSFTSFSQEYWRNYELEKELLIQINNHRDSIGANTLVYDNVNTTALMWANVLVEEAVTTENLIYHCDCHPGGENLLDMNASYNMNTNKKRNLDDDGFIGDATQDIITSWLNSPLHKEVLEFDDTYLSWIPSMERHTVIVYMYKVEGEYGGVRILVVYQNRHPKQYYIDMGWGNEDI